jgi:hypothetical protein
MGKFDSVITKYRQLGVSEDNLEYVEIAVRKGVQREHIMNSLTADYRKLTPVQAQELLEDFYKANGGEFKKDNRSGYFWGTCLLIIGVACSLILYRFYTNGRVLLFPAYVWAGAILGVLGGVVCILSAVFGVFREKDLIK